MQTLIVANGQLTDRESIPQDRLQPELIIAVDGGWLHCQSLGLVPDVVIGDFDSLQDSVLEKIEETDTQLIHHQPEKDEIDLELALIYAVEQGAKDIVILAGLGGRFDMSLANVALLLHPELTAVEIEFWHFGQRIWLIQPPGDEILGEIGDTLSLLPFGGDAEGIETENLAYPLESETLTMGPARGISNVLTAERASVKLTQGALLAVWSRGRA